MGEGNSGVEVSFGAIELTPELIRHRPFGSAESLQSSEYEISPDAQHLPIMSRGYVQSARRRKGLTVTFGGLLLVWQIEGIILYQEL